MSSSPHICHHSVIILKCSHLVLCPAFIQVFQTEQLKREPNISVFMVHTSKVGDLGSSFNSSKVKAESQRMPLLSGYSLHPNMPAFSSGRVYLIRKMNKYRWLTPGDWSSCESQISWDVREQHRSTAPWELHALWREYRNLNSSGLRVLSNLILFPLSQLNIG